MTRARRRWQKSSRSSADGQCLEVAPTPDGIEVRDSKDPDGPVLAFPWDEWAEFIGRVKRGEVG
ncbi:DUF397 domain-containing protein [Streptomyces sp. 5K101]|uniref:DUF397 domain-containing protein n=1 Tax=Streptomyces sp. 5K101 TaxID=3390037 RepID=UPI0039762BCB